MKAFNVYFRSDLQWGSRQLPAANARQARGDEEGMSYAAQCCQVPAGASGSSQFRASPLQRLVRWARGRAIGAWPSPALEPQ
jgi:hypothetical protein